MSGADNAGEKSPADIFCDGLIELCQENDRPYIFEQLIDTTLRPYLAVLDGAENQSSEWVAEAVSGLVNTMITNFVARVVPRDDQAAAIEVAQDIVNALGASLSADIHASYTERPTQATIMKEALAKKKAGKLN